MLTSQVIQSDITTGARVNSFINSTMKRKHQPYSQDPEIHTAVCHQHRSDILLHTAVEWCQVVLYTMSITLDQELSLVGPQISKTNRLNSHLLAAFL